VIPVARPVQVGQHGNAVPVILHQVANVKLLYPPALVIQLDSMMMVMETVNLVMLHAINVQDQLLTSVLHVLTIEILGQMALAFAETAGGAMMEISHA